MPDRAKSVVVPAVVAAVAAVALVVALLTGGDEESPQPAADRSSASTPTPSASEPAGEQDPMSLGDPDAPVVMHAYSEFQCPFCGRFARETQPTLVDEYVDAGVLRIEHRDFPYLGPESLTAAQAGRAAAAQGAFWEFHDWMFEHQEPPNSGRLDREFFLRVARHLDLDEQRFTEDMYSEQTMEAIRTDFDAGQQAGVTGTPGFVVNGQLVMGAQPTRVFEKVIEDAAAAASDG